jgi:hypothetical protein
MENLESHRATKTITHTQHTQNCCLVKPDDDINFALPKSERAKTRQ